MVFCSEYYGKKAEDLHERERDIKAARGKIIDATGTVLATNRTVCTISVIHSQVKEPEKVIEVLTKELGLEEETVRKRVEKVSSIERVKSNVDKETGDKIRDYRLEGVKVDEDYKRYYPFDTLASKVLGFTGGDNQGIIGLEVIYEDYLKGTNGKMLKTVIDYRNMTEAELNALAVKNLRRAAEIDGYRATMCPMLFDKLNEWMEKKPQDYLAAVFQLADSPEIKKLAEVDYTMFIFMNLGYLTQDGLF